MCGDRPVKMRYRGMFVVSWNIVDVSKTIYIKSLIHAFIYRMTHTQKVTSVLSVSIL